MNFKLSLIPKRFTYLNNRIGNVLYTSATNSEEYVLYSHHLENYIFVVENNTTTTTILLQRIFQSPNIYFWLLLIVWCVVLRCGLQWINESETTPSTIKQRRCVFMCQDTVQLSCGVVMHASLFASQRYRHALVAHGATIIPCVAGIFISGILYGEYLMRSEEPNIDSFAQVIESRLTMCIPWEGDTSNFQVLR